MPRGLFGFFQTTANGGEPDRGRLLLDRPFLDVRDVHRFEVQETPFLGSTLDSDRDSSLDLPGFAPWESKQTIKRMVFSI